MNEKQKLSSLLSHQAKGGDTAEGGFQYQANLITAKIPNWLSQGGFTQMIRESLGDVEASFFVPRIGLSREFIEYKNHYIKPVEFWKEVEHFYKIDQECPDSYHKFILACTGISENLKPLTNSLQRIRNAYPFYKGDKNIQEPSFNDFVQIIKNFNQPESIAKFIFTKVWFEIDLTDAEDHPRELFRESLFTTFPVFEELAAKVSSNAYSRLTELIKSRKNKPINRTELETAIWKNIAPEYQPPSCIKIHTIHDENSHKKLQNYIQFNWISFFGGIHRNYPSSNDWNNILLEELKSTKNWIISNNRPRKVYISGHRRLSASIAIGAIFSSVSGFVLEIETKDGNWITNNYPEKDTPNYNWSRDFYLGKNPSEVAIVISIKRNIKNEVEQYLIDKNFLGGKLHLKGDLALLSDKHTNKAVDEAKKLIVEVISKYNVKKIHLFIAGPSQLALFLGHRLNAICPIQCYEYQNTNLYTPTCLISI